ncbi:MAG: glycosyltransferase family 39 protein, partial [Acidobacteria bacterium]|nr:glycosyltransferase family 39 protein [Acidobacteriota bacterium]
MKKSLIIFACLFVLGAGLRAADLRHPIDRPSWREADDAGIARNFYREGMNPFYPRVDWRGTTPGFAEMELPVYPWSIAVLYKLFGYHEIFPRLLSFLISLAAMLVFFKLARYLLPEVGAFAAALFFVLNPVAINLATWIQPDGLMFLCYTLAVYAFLRWLDSDSWKHYAIAIVATAFAILAKATAGHIGLLFAVLLLNRKGWKAVRQPRVILFALLTLLPAALWYTHARSFWRIYGNSLGVSNEYHWAGWDLFTDPGFVTGIWRQELLHIWMPTGLVLAAVGVLLGKSERAVKISLAWLFSIFVYYLIVARTSADDWAFYYHIVSLPPVALLVGAGVCAIRRLTLSPRLVFQLIIGSILLTI